MIIINTTYVYKLRNYNYHFVPHTIYILSVELISILEYVKVVVIDV